VIMKTTFPISHLSLSCPLSSMHSGEIDCLAGWSERLQLMLEPVKSFFYWEHEAFLMGVASMNCAGAWHLHAEGGFYFIVIWMPFQILSHMLDLRRTTSWSFRHQPRMCLSPKPDDTCPQPQTRRCGPCVLIIVLSLCFTAAISQSKAV